MPIIIFSLTTATGIYLTSFAFRKIIQRGKFTNHTQAMIIAIGWGLTIFLSLFLTIRYPGTKVEIDWPIIALLLGITISSFITSYLVMRVLLKFRIYSLISNIIDQFISKLRK